MPVSLKQFKQHVVESSLVMAEDLESLLKDLGPDQQPKDPQQLARLLVKQKKLTTYQAQQIYAGKGKSLVFGNYDILNKLGQGGMGVVLRGRHRRMHRDVAIKVLPAAMVKDEAAIARFQREVIAAAQLMHSNIVAAYDADEIDGQHVLIMEYVEGRDLSSIVKKDGPLNVEQAVDCVLQTARGLEFAHERGVIHRDIKPANLLLDNRGTVKILDMGLARFSEGIADVGTQAELTGTGTIMGTVDYMSPEQALSTKTADARSDIYSLGITLYYLITGKPAYSGETLTARLLAHQTAPIPTMKNLQPAVPANVQAVFEKMVAKKPEDRYANMTEVIADLETCKSGQSGSSLLSKSSISGAGEASATGLSGFLQTLNGEAGSATAPTRTAIAVQSADHQAQSGEYEATVISGVMTETTPTLQTKSERLRRRRAGIRSLLTDWRVLSGGGVGLAVLLVVMVMFSRKGPEKISDVPETPAAATKSVAAISSRHSTNVPPPINKAPGATGGLPASAPPLAIAPFDAVQAKAHQQAWADYLGLPVEYTNSIGMKFRLIPPSEFLMGSTPEEIQAALQVAGEDEVWRERIKSEAPQHKVVFTQPVYVGVTEVTQSQYEQVMGTNPSHFSATGEGKDAVADLETGNHPVETVSWNDAAEFCAKLSQQEELKPFYSRSGETVTPLDGTGYRLPTEAEWESACRAGTTTRFWSGDAEQDLIQAGWFRSNSGGRTHAAGELKANPFGLSDVHGNVWECVQDSWDPAFYGQSEGDAAINPYSPYSAGSQRVIRGGHWGNTPSHCHSSNRFANYPPHRFNSVGFRVVLPVNAVKQLLSSDAAPLPSQGANAIAWKSALQFDGIDDYVAVPSIRYDGKSPLTIEVRLRSETPKNSQIIKIREAGSPNLYIGWHETQESVITFYNHHLTGTDYVHAAEFWDGHPTHIAGVINTDETRLFIDGRKITFGFSDSIIAPARRLGMTIGAELAPAPRHHYKGVIEGVRLSSAALYDKDFAPPTEFESSADTLALYQFDEGEGDILHDSSGNGHDGKILGATWVKVPGSPLATISPGASSGSPADAHAPSQTNRLAYLDPAFQRWIAATQKLPAQQRIEAVARKLKELNPKFDGSLKGRGSDHPKIRNGKVIEVRFHGDGVTDLSPLRVFSSLERLFIYCTFEQGELRDLSPLAGLPLTNLICFRTQIADLSPLHGAPLEELICEPSRVTDLSPLEGMPLVELGFAATPVTDLTPLKGLPLQNLYLMDSDVSDLTPLSGMSLRKIAFTPRNITKGIDVLREMTSLQFIGHNSAKENIIPAAEFWKKYDAGEFGTPARGGASSDDPADSSTR